MAITQATLAQSGLSGISSFVTAAFTPSVNKLGLFSIHSVLSGTANTPTITSTTTGLTLVQVGVAKNEGYAVTVFRAMKPSGLSNGTISVGFAGQGQDHVDWNYSEFDGIDTSGTDGSGAIVQSATNFNAGDVNVLTVTLAAFGNANNGTYFATTWKQVTGTMTGFTPTAGFTEIIDDPNHTDLFGCHLCWRADNSTNCTSTAAGGTGHSCMLALEIKAPGGTAYTLSLAGDNYVLSGTDLRLGYQGPKLALRYTV